MRSRRCSTRWPRRTIGCTGSPTAPTPTGPRGTPTGCATCRSCPTCSVARPCAASWSTSSSASTSSTPRRRLPSRGRRTTRHASPSGSGARDGPRSRDRRLRVRQLAQLVLEQLVERTDRELVDHVDRARHLERRETLRTRVDHGRLERRLVGRVGRRDHERDDDLVEEVVVLADDGDLRDAGYRRDQLLDLARRDVLATDLQQVLVTLLVEDVAARTHLHDVTG